MEIYAGFYNATFFSADTSAGPAEANESLHTAWQRTDTLDYFGDSKIENIFYV